MIRERVEGVHSDLHRRRCSLWSFQTSSWIVSALTTPNSQCAAGAPAPLNTDSTDSIYSDTAVKQSRRLYSITELSPCSLQLHWRILQLRRRKGSQFSSQENFPDLCDLDLPVQPLSLLCFHNFLCCPSEVLFSAGSALNVSGGHLFHTTLRCLPEEATSAYEENTHHTAM